jgi:predicted ATPase/DNA-binding CsgD family transcriptional regulator
MGDGGGSAESCGALPVQLTRFFGREAEVADLLGRLGEERLVRECRSVSVRTTSRAALGVAGERVWTVPQLGVAAAVELFVDRARSVSGGASFEEADDLVIEEICARLDCLPLAIELAAAWSRVLSPRQVLDRLTLVSPELPAAGRSRESRHGTMAAAVGWSYRLLAEDAQRLFRQLSVFAGTFDLEAVEAIAGAGDSTAADEALGWLSVLVDNSLVLAERVAGGPMRYRMLQPVRQYAAALLAAGGDGDDVRRRHFDHYLDVARRWDPWRIGVVESVSLERLAQDEGNLVAAFEWARSRPAEIGLGLGLAAAAYFAYGGRVNDGLRWLEDALAKGTEDSHLQVAALAEAGQLAWRQGDYGLGHARLDEALARAGLLDDPFLHARILIVLSAVELSVGNIAIAARDADEAVVAFRGCGDELHVARALVARAWARYAQGDADAGAEDMRAALDANRSFGNPTVAAYGHFGLAYGAGLKGDTDTMRTHLGPTLSAMNDGGIVERSEWLALSGVLAAIEGRAHTAWRLSGGAEALARRRGGVKTPERMRAPFAPLFVSLFEQLGSALVERLATQGQQMSWDELVDQALAQPGVEPSPLTAREHEIADLVAIGLTNVGIAHKLVISPRTVESHVDHIRQKLGLGSRNEIIVWTLRDAATSHYPPRKPSQDP